MLVHKPYHFHRGFVLAVDGGAGGGRPPSRPNVVIPAGCYVPRPVAAHRAWSAAGRRVVGGGGMPFPPGSLRAVVTELSCSR